MIFKNQHNIDVYIILNGKGDLTGCDLRGYSLVSILTCQSNIVGCF